MPAAIAPATSTVATRVARLAMVLATRFIAGYELGLEWSFMFNGDIDVQAWAPRAGHLVLQLVDHEGRVLRTVTVCPGEYRQHEVITGDRVVITETHGAEAAFGAALDYLAAPLLAELQHEHDACAV